MVLQHGFAMIRAPRRWPPRAKSPAKARTRSAPPAAFQPVGGFTDPATILLQETEEQVALIGSPNQMEAVMANMQKREPKFADPAA